ncbi:archaeal/vacuolar-type H+-ATPase subunit E [Methanoregula formicica SMSP]|uniref:A-type ATP synthase subunit E n=1 Tax=Methanoregula formicica (strain DSM 22288 / NBRC 105244 / SMSP) TaxID=593750 RepID=L0HC04_METFS|nr:archaeal/vacuolar-type H+-ATPase subunit E [Methanoregula formicica SMSP]
MAYDNLLKSVEESAEARERELLQKAEQQAEAIRAEARKRAEEIQQATIRDAERSVAIERNKQLYLAKGETKEKSLRGREKIFLSAFAEAERRLSGLRQDKQYPAIFERLARETVSAVGTNPFVLHVDKRDLDLCRTTLAAIGIRCEVIPDIECAGGLVAASPDGLVTIANTVESRIERIREHKRLAIYKILSGG